MASSTLPSNSVPSGQSPPLYRITLTDQAGTIVIVTALCLITAVISILVRAYVMMQSGTFLRLRWDDWAVSTALLLAVIQTSVVQREAATGLGRTIRNLTKHEGQQIQRLQYADQIFYILSVWVSKLSATIFFYRLSPRSNDRKTTKGAIMLIGITGVTAILLLCFVCDMGQPWQYFTQEGVICTAPYNRWIGVSVMDILSEVVLACLATKVLWPLKMQPSRKLAAGFIFFQRLVIIAPILAQLYFLSTVYHGDDPTLQAAYATLCKETQVAFAIVATNIPCFKKFLIATATHYGAPAEGAKSTYGFTAGTRTGDSVQLANLSPNMQSNTSSQQQSSQGSRIRRYDFSPHDRNQSVAAVISRTPERGDTLSNRSDDSRELIIRKDVNYDVQYYDGELGRHVRSVSE